VRAFLLVGCAFLVVLLGAARVDAAVPRAVAMGVGFPAVAHVRHSLRTTAAPRCRDDASAGARRPPEPLREVRQRPVRWGGKAPESSISGILQQPLGAKIETSLRTRRRRKARRLRERSLPSIERRPPVARGPPCRCRD
jgi:hypothetical protein